MTTHEFDERLSAYLDGKLSASERTQLEGELQQDPQLRASLERLKKLDQLARQARVEMPADGYFDGLASRIDAKLARDAQPRRGFASSQPIMTRGRLIAILSSVAAVFIVVVAVNQFWKPEAERYTIPKTVIVNPPQKPESSGRSNAQPAIATEPIKKSDQKRRQEIPDTVLGKVIESDQTPVGVKDEEYKERPVFPEHNEVKQTLAVPEKSDAVTASPVDTIRQLVRGGRSNEMPIMIDTPSGSGLEKPTSGVQSTALAEKKQASPQTPAAQPRFEMNASIVRSDKFQIAAPSIPLALDSVQTSLPAESVHKGTPSDTFDPAVFEQRVQALLDSGKYVPVRLVAWDRGNRSESRSQYDVEQGSLRNWYDSLNVIGTEQWQAENAYREAGRSRGNRLADCITARLYIEHYLNSGQTRDSGIWLERLNEVRRWEQEIKK